MRLPVRVHCLSIEAALAAPASLCPEERERRSRFRNEEDADRYEGGRRALRAILARETGLSAEALVFESGAHGKPTLKQRSECFNVSHSGRRILIAVGATSVGVDVELVDPELDPLEIAPSVFDEREIEAVVRLEADARLREFFRLWTLKEAVLKAWGTGFSLDARAVHLGIPARQRVSHAGFADAVVLPLSVGEGYAAAVAAIVPASAQGQAVELDVSVRHDS